MLVGFEGSDDAAVVQLTDTLAVVLTVDFITPVVDDPFAFGTIAAANALSDVFAMGGEAKSALNVLAWDKCNIDKGCVQEILRGGLSKINEAGAALVGGHSVADKEQKYGLSVMGLVNPQRIWRNNTPQIGDSLLLTKPLGSGILSTALKRGKASKSEIDEVTCVMNTLNLYAARVMRAFDVHACTDITGFGLVGHAFEMAGGAEGIFALNLDCGAVPLMGGVKEKLTSGILPGGSSANREVLGKYVNIQSDGAHAYADIFFDAQTSGGLLFALPSTQAPKALEALRKEGIMGACIGDVTQRKNWAITLG